MLNSKLDLSLPYISEALPGIGGLLRASPDHFIVDEVPLYEAEGAGQHLYVNLTKVGLTTKEVQRRLERLFGLKRGDVSFAGMKDKQARTTQTFSLSVGYQGSKSTEFAEEAGRRIAASLPVTVNWALFHRNKLRLGHLLGNRFSIVVSGLDISDDLLLERARAIVNEIQVRGLPNYFGPQRLGRDGSNVQQGLAILRGEQKKQDRWLRQFLISAFQSYLCNRYLARRLENDLFDRLLPGDVAKKYATGGLFSVEDLQTEQDRFAAHEISFTAPIYGPKMWQAGGEAGAFEEAILAEAEVTLEDFARVRVEGTRTTGSPACPRFAGRCP